MAGIMPGAATDGGIFVWSQCTGPFHSARIDSNRVFDIWGDGIYFLGAGGAFSVDTVDHTLTGGRWDSLSAGVVLRGNSVRRTSGDGIVCSGANDPLIERNVVDSAAGRESQ